MGNDHEIQSHVAPFCKMTGGVYGWFYRAAMGCAAVGRLAFLAIPFPFVNIVWDGVPELRGAKMESCSEVGDWAARVGVEDR